MLTESPWGLPQGWKCSVAKCGNLVGNGR
jgi:hypothetical protein